jgi:hypothetical protein
VVVTSDSDPQLKLATSTHLQSAAGSHSSRGQTPRWSSRSREYPRIFRCRLCIECELTRYQADAGGSPRSFIGRRFVADTISNAERANFAWTRSEGVSTASAPTGRPCRLGRHRLVGWPRMARPRARQPAKRLLQKRTELIRDDPPFPSMSVRDRLGRPVTSAFTPLLWS